MRPIASKRDIQRRVRYWVQRMGFNRPWRVTVTFMDHPAGELIDPNDPDCYCAAESDPQYHRVRVFISTRHPGWVRETHGLDSTIRHELAHGITSPLTRFTANLLDQFVTDPAIRAALQHSLEDLDDTVVDRIAEMPVFDGEAP